MKLLLAIISVFPKTMKDIFSAVLVCAHKAVDCAQKFISPSFSSGFSFVGKRALGIVLLGVMNFIGNVSAWLPATPSARQWSLSIGSVHSIFFLHLSVFAWPTMVELRKFFDPFISFISKTTVSFNLRAEKKDQFMLLKECKFSNSKFYQVLDHGDLSLSN